jgi:hypothetical protein
VLQHNVVRDAIRFDERLPEHASCRHPKRAKAKQEAPMHAEERRSAVEVVADS